MCVSQESSVCSSQGGGGTLVQNHWHVHTEFDETCIFKSPWSPWSPWLHYSLPRSPQSCPLVLYYCNVENICFKFYSASSVLVCKGYHTVNELVFLTVVLLTYQRHQTNLRTLGTRGGEGATKMDREVLKAGGSAQQDRVCLACARLWVPSPPWKMKIKIKHGGTWIKRDKRWRYLFKNVCLGLYLFPENILMRLPTKALFQTIE